MDLKLLQDNSFDVRYIVKYPNGSKFSVQTLFLLT